MRVKGKNTVQTKSFEVETGTVLIAFSTYPLGQASEYIKTVEENIEEYKRGRAKEFIDVKNYTRKEKVNPENINEVLPNKKINNFHLYHNPVKYHLFGKYDIAFISLIDNLAISNKLFLPTRLRTNHKLGSIKTHVLSGMSIKTNGTDIEEKFTKILGYSENKKEYLNTQETTFICISNIKLNNTYVLGNGYNFIEKVKDYIEYILKDTLHLLINSFGSFEYSLVLFGNDLNELNRKILTIRKATIREICAADLNKILINSILGKNNQKKVRNNLSHVIENTQSFFGVKLNLKDDNTLDWSIHEYDKFKTQIEWEIKPGHEGHVRKLIDSSLLNFQPENYFIPGRRDYLFENYTDNLKLNFDLFNILFQNNSELGKHIRKIKTNILFEDPDVNINDPDLFIIPTIVCEKFVKDNKEIDNLRQALKSLKISRELRTRILKMYLNFNSVIQNPLVYHHFIDLYYFLDFVYENIIKWSNDINKFFGVSFYPNGKIKEFTTIYPNINIYSVHDLEVQLTKIAEIYKDAFNIRYINNYLLDDASEFLLEYNSPLQQIITSFDNYFKALYSMLLEDNNISASKRIVTRVNQLDTTADSLSVNFSLYNLFEPGILFYYATKEIFVIKYKEFPYDKIITFNKLIFKNFWKRYFKQNPNSPGRHLKNNFAIFNHTYFIIDAQRLLIFFENDFKLFLFWHLSFITQYPAMYESNGKINSEQFVKEFTRLLFLALYLDLKLDEPMVNEKILLESNPYPDLFHIWNKTYKEIREPLYDLLTKSDNEFIFELKNPIRLDFVGLLEKFVKSININEDINVSDTINDIKNLAEIKTLDIFSLLNSNFNTLNLNNLNEYLIPGSLKSFSITLTKDYLKYIYRKNNPDNLKELNVSKLNRNWIDGRIISSNLNKFKDSFFINDSNGGAFFHSFENLKKFSEIRNNIFLLLFHQSYLIKKILLEDGKQF